MLSPEVSIWTRISHLRQHTAAASRSRASGTVAAPRARPTSRGSQPRRVGDGSCVGAASHAGRRARQPAGDPECMEDLSTRSQRCAPGAESSTSRSGTSLFLQVEDPEASLRKLRPSRRWTRRRPDRTRVGAPARSSRALDVQPRDVGVALQRREHEAARGFKASGSARAAASDRRRS